MVSNVHNLGTMQGCLIFKLCVENLKIRHGKIPQIMCSRFDSHQINNSCMGREESSWGYIDREEIKKMINECLTEQFIQVLFYQSVFRNPRDTSNMVRKLKNKVFKEDKQITIINSFQISRATSFRGRGTLS